MLPDIWTQCAQKFKFVPYSGAPWRVVEAQHVIATRKLVDSDEEQEILENIIDAAKPPKPYDQECALYHYLLWTPFRYPPLEFGSRFGNSDQRGIWYGSETIETAFAEKAYYTFLFRSGSKAELGIFETSVTTFCVPITTHLSANLTHPPFEQFEKQLMSPDSYGISQQIGSGLRDQSAEVIRFRSARCLDNGMNVAVIKISAFQKREPDESTTWFCISSEKTVEFKPVGIQPKVRRTIFRRSDFERNGNLLAIGS